MRITTSDDKLNKGIEIAQKDIELNINEYKSGVLAAKKPVLLTGGEYDRPWTRDASIITYNYLAIGLPEIAKNTLLSVLNNSG